MAQKSVRTIPNGCSKCKGGHQNQTPQPLNKEERKERVERGAKDFAERFEGVMKDLAEDEAPQPKSDEAIVEEFDDRMFKKNAFEIYSGSVDDYVIDREKVKDYIRTILTRKNKEKEEAVREERERIETALKHVPCHGDGEICGLTRMKCTTHRAILHALTNNQKET